MKIFVILCTFVSLSYGIIPLAKDETITFLGKRFYKNGKPEIPKTATQPKIFLQCMDHFNSSGCNVTWEQRYWVKQTYWNGTGPIFFQFGGEGPADALIDNYYWHTYAENYGALMIVLEHRFYGESYPSYDESIETLELLTSQQALADAAYFIEQYNKNITGKNKWVTFGGSYAGNLAAWMKQKYPSHVVTAVASSGPLEGTYDFPGYLGTVSAVTKELDNECFKLVFESYECMESLVNGNVCGNYTDVNQILPALQQCSSVDFSNKLSRETFFNIISMGLWADNWPSSGILRNCEVIKSLETTDPVSLYGDFLVSMNQGGECNDLVSWAFTEQGKAAGANAWFWQTCYEFGYYMSSDPVLGMFGRNTFSGDPYGVSCSSFDSRFTKDYVKSRINYTNSYYKGKEIDSSCVIFVNGAWDPWHTLGINNINETEHNAVVHIPGAEHCDDMLNPKTEQMIIAQSYINDQIGIYLNSNECL